MQDDSAFFTSGLFQSPTSSRLYLMEQGFVIAELPAKADTVVPNAGTERPLEAAAELDYLLRKISNLRTHLQDLEGVAAFGVRHVPADDAFQPTDLGRLDLTKMAPALWPRLVQLGNTGLYLYAQGGWRHLVRPDATNLGVLARLPATQLVADDGLETFLAKEIANVAEEMRGARKLLDELVEAAENP